MIRVGLAAALVLAAVMAGGGQFVPVTATLSEADGEEFVGPFPSWASVKAYGATGDGAADDSGALQRGLDDLGRSGGPAVLYVPAGTYRVTRTLTLSYKLNVSLVGEDPARTVLRWDGSSGGTLLDINGVAYSRIDRLTFDGRGVASVGVEQSWDGSRPNFDTGNQYADDVFTDLQVGIRGGHRGHGFAETSIRRARFIRNTRAGVSLGNFNALDAWIWDSTFQDCAVGVTNTFGAGNFRVYNSLFERSTVADMSMANTGGVSARGNYSVGSRAFFVAGGTNNPATIHLQANTIIDPSDTTPIRVGNQGPGTVTDNVIRSSGVGPAMTWSSFSDTDVTSVGNTFTVANAIRGNGRVVSIDDRTVARDSITPTPPVMPVAPMPGQRRVFEVAPGSGAAEIQSVIVEAARRSGQRPIVHLPNGLYAIDQTLSVPSSDLQIVGDGFGTILRWTGRSSGPVLHLRGPTKVTVRELQIDGAAMADGVLATDADQAGGRVYADQLQSRGSRTADVQALRLQQTHVQFEDFGHAGARGATAVQVVGDPAAPRRAMGRVSIFSGAASGNRVSYDVSEGGRLLLRDLWYESGAGPGFARTRGQALLTVDGARVSSPVGGTPAAFSIEDLRGRVSIVATHLDDRIEIVGGGSEGDILALGVYREQPNADYFVNAAQPAARAMLVNSRHVASVPGVRTGPTADVGARDDAFILAMLAHARTERPQRLRALPAGVTDLRLFRVWIANGLTNLRVLPGSGS